MKLIIKSFLLESSYTQHIIIIQKVDLLMTHRENEKLRDNWTSSTFYGFLNSIV